ncbi:branched-chain amino acid ABC transporter permease [Thermodesulforhabdus norvegica]|uniref:Branched-chain amino acid transport system permease protein n=1 Tax=Thermodesulforhabdus norvegica TaxID=39841 RepID=A0A1I4UQG1_9BACT|nr:branched-chain amino acid ABC transporter permease [Thermodesulforhabdus norvegica]SFM91145.1 branched-chain amino acid transport system permease protein [Thermodesulforhabdus norvegica]
MEILLQLLVQALSLGSFYTLLSLGFALIFGVTHVFNLAHGEFIIISGYCAYYLIRQMGLSLPQVLPATIFISVLLAFCLNGLVRQERKSEELQSLIVTFGLSLVIQHLLMGIFSADYRIIFHKPRLYTLPLLSVTVTSLQLYLIVLSVATVTALYLLFRKTFLGKALRATIQDRYTAQLAGISIRQMRWLALLLGGVAIGIAGPLFAHVFYLHPSGGMEPTVIAMIITIFAGTGRIRGLIVGGWILGFLETTTAFLWGPEWCELALACVLLILLIWKPHGVLTPIRISR